MVTIAQTKTATTGSGVTTIAATWSNNTVTGNCIIVAVQGNNSTGITVSSITDSQSNHYTLAKRSNTSADCEIWYAYNITGGTTPTVTATLSGSVGSSSAMVIREYNGVLNSADPLDQTASGNGSGTTQASAATPNTTVASELLIGAVAATSSTTYSAGTQFNNIANATSSFGGIAIEDRIVNTSGLYASSFTSGSVIWDSAIATFKLPQPGFKSNNMRPRLFAPGLAR